MTSTVASSLAATESLKYTIKITTYVSKVMHPVKVFWYSTFGY